ncbi:MAG: UPF0182 family protein, partial [Streptomycetales bacterium]
MTFHMPDSGEGPRRPTFPRTRRSRALLPTMLVVIVLIAAFSLFTSLWTDLRWYRSVGYTQVFTTQLWTRLGLFLAFGFVLGVVVAFNVLVAYRLRPPFRGMSLEQQSLDRYRMGLDPYRGYVLIGIACLVGVLSGVSASGQWQTWLQWRNAQPFNRTDPQFGMDIAFYAFTLPWYRFVLGFAFAGVILCIFAALATHYLYGGLRIQTPGQKASPAAQAHLSVLIGAFVLLKAVAYWLDRYALAVSSDPLFEGFTGLTFKDDNAVLPAKTILFVIAIICAALFFANVFRRTWMLPGVGFGLLVFAAVLIGGVYPAIVQQFQVRPSEADKEAPYIKRNIDATRSAYDVGDAQVEEYEATTRASAGQLRSDAETAASIRLLDPAVVSSTFQALQQIKGYYAFPEALDIDRYEVDGRRQDVVVAMRELDLGGLPSGQQNWINEHLRYTHGFGLVAALASTRERDGKPSYVEGQIPPEGAFGDYQPRIYFGQHSPEYSIVGAPEGVRAQELDYPDDTKASGQRDNTYQGSGGIPIGSFFSQLLFALKFQEEKILLSSGVNDASRILYIRNPRQRVEKVAPWLTLDGNTYPAVVNGRVVWIIDGYTTTDSYPYSTRTTIQDVTTDALTTAQRAVLTPRNQANYIRNSVKATVDAYSGEVKLYAWEERDPVLRTWMDAFPGTVQPRSKISDALLEHLRYPEDLFKVQREILTRYHVKQPQAFYGGQDYWRIPED